MSVGAVIPMRSRLTAQSHEAHLEKLREWMERASPNAFPDVVIALLIDGEGKLCVFPSATRYLSNFETRGILAAAAEMATDDACDVDAAP